MKSIAMKLWVGMMALCVCILLLLWFFQIVFLDSFYTNMHMTEIKKEAISILKVLEEGNEVEFQNRLEEFAYNNTMTAELVDRQNQILFLAGNVASGTHMPMIRNAVRIEAYNKVLAGQTVLLSIQHPRFGSQFMLIGMPVIIAGELEGGFFMNLPLLPVKDTVKILKKQLYIITVLLLVFAILISFMLSRTFTKPIREITAVSMKMAEGDLSARIRIKGSDEIGRLGKTINHMGQELGKIEQLRKDLIANVSHELRTPLSLIKGYAETIHDISGDNPEKREKHLSIIMEEADRLTHIVEDILDLSQMQSGYSNLHMATVNIDEILQRIIQKYDLTSEKTGVKIVLHSMKDAYVKADEKRINQVLYNLLSNAFHHAPKGSTITVHVVDKKDTVRIEIKDTGAGIPEDQIESIWERFYKADTSGTRKDAGSGLGLSIVKSILMAHQAPYGVESQVDIGTNFWFTLKKI
jgi:signal transduction histidine kinase